MSETNHLLAASLTILIIMLVAAGLGVLAFFIYLLRQGVQYSLGDLVLGSLVLGIAPSFGTMMTENMPGKDTAGVWVGACALTLMLAVYMLYGFYWASIRPTPTPRGQLRQRFLGALCLAVGGSFIPLLFQAFVRA